MEKKILNNERLKESPFTVPAGYFAKMQEEVMGKLPEREHSMEAVSLRRHAFLRPVMTAAASVCVAVFGVTAYLHFFNPDSRQEETESAQALYSSADEVSDYIGMDNEDIYDYISEL